MAYKEKSVNLALLEVNIVENWKFSTNFSETNNFKKAHPTV